MCTTAATGSLGAGNAVTTGQGGAVGHQIARNVVTSLCTTAQLAAAAPAKPPPRAKVARRAGETAAADIATPAAQRAQMFGTAIDASTFEGLGLASSLADHLEGGCRDALLGD